MWPRATGYLAPDVLKQCSVLICHVRNAQETLTLKCPVPNTQSRSAESQNTRGLNCHFVRWKSYVCLRAYSRKYFYEFCSELFVFIELLEKNSRKKGTSSEQCMLGSREKSLCCHMQDTARVFHHSSYTCNSYQTTGRYSHDCTA